MADEIDFDDLDLGDMEGAPDETGGEDDFSDLDDLSDLDLGDTDIEEDDGDSDDLFDDLDEVEDDTIVKEKAPPKKSLLAGRWQYPLFAAAFVLAVLNFIVYPAAEMKHNKMQRYDRLARTEIEKENWGLAKQYLDQVFQIDDDQGADVQQMIADVSFALAEQIRINPEKPTSLLQYAQAKKLYQALKDMRDPETEKPVLATKDSRFYVDYQMARCTFHQNLFNEARGDFEKLQTKVDKNNRRRLADEKRGRRYSAAEEVFSNRVSSTYPLAQKRAEILNYLGQTTEKMERLQESILWFKRYAPFAELGMEQLRVWEKIAQGYFLDGDIDSAIAWYDKIAKEYTTYDEAKDALYELGNLLRKNKRFSEARDRLKRSSETGTIDEQHNEKVLFLIGQTYLDENDLKNATRIFKKTLATAIKYHDRPVGTAGALKEGEVLYKRGTYDKAYEHYQRIVKTRSFVFDNPFVSQKEVIAILQNMAVDAFQKQEYHNAENIYRFMLEHFKTKREFVLNKLAEAIVAQAKKEGMPRLIEAGITYQRIPVEAGGSNLDKESRAKAADLFFKAGDWAKAEKAYGTFLDVYPGDPQEAKASYRRGMALKMLLQLSERSDDEKKTLIGGAEFYFKDTINKYAHSLFSYRARYELGLIYARRDNWKGARKAFTTIINDDLFTPRSRVWKDSLFELGRVEHFMDLPVPAIKHLLEAIERYPSDPRVFASHSYLGQSYFKLKKYKDARKQLRQVISTPRTSDLDKDLQRYAELTIADTYVREGDYVQALSAYKSAFSKYQRSSDAPWINFQIARCLERLKQPEQALVEYNKALWLYKRSKKETFQELPQNLRKKYWKDQVDWSIDTKKWFQAQKKNNDTFFRTLN